MKIIKTALIIVTISVLAACMTKTGDLFKTEHNDYQLSKQLNLEPQQRADLYEAIIAADLSRFNKDYLSAMSYYLYAAEISKNQELIQRSLEMAQIINDPLGIEQAANLWLSVSPNDPQALAILLEAQLEQQNIEEAIQTASDLLKNNKNSEKRFELLEQHALNKDPRVSFNLLRELNAQNPTDVAIITAQAKFLFNMANVNKQSNQLLPQAIQKVEEALSIDSLFNPAIRLKTHILFQSRRDLEAQTYLQNLFLKHPESSAINQMLGQLLYDLKDYHASIRHYTLWLEKHPKDLEARNYLAASYYALGQYQQSLDNFKLLLGKDYQPDTVAFYCGDSALKLELLTQATDCFSLVNQGRFVSLAKIRLSTLFIEKNQNDKALAVLTGKYDLDEKDKVRLKLAEIDLLNKHFSNEQAKQQLDLAMKDDPENIAFLLKKIDLYGLTNQPEPLNELLLQARGLFEVGPKLDNFNLAVAALLKNNHHYQLAINWLDDAIKQKPNDKDLLYTRALYKEPLGLYNEMIAEFKFLLNLYPDDLNIKNALGYTLTDLNLELNYAQALIDSAYQGLPDNVAVIDSKGWLAFRLGQIDTAEEYLKRAFKLSPSAEVAAHLGEVLWIKKQQQLAKEIFQQGLTIDNKNKILLETLERLKIEL